MSKAGEGEMCFLNKLLLLAVLGWLFQVGGQERATTVAGGGGREVGEGGCRNLMKVGARGRRGRGMGSTMCSEEDCLDPGAMRWKVWSSSEG